MVADMVFRKLSSAAATTAVVLTATACGTSSLPATDSAKDLEHWVANTMPQPAEGGFTAAGSASPDGGRHTSTITGVEQGEYAVTVACTPTGSSAEPQTASVRLGLGGSAFYGDMDCSVGPVTAATYIEDPSKSGPLDVAVRVETDTEALLWAVSASPTTSP